MRVLGVSIITYLHDTDTPPKTVKGDILEVAAETASLIEKIIRPVLSQMEKI